MVEHAECPIQYIDPLKVILQYIFFYQMLNFQNESNLTNLILRLFDSDPSEHLVN